MWREEDDDDAGPVEMCSAAVAEACQEFIRSIMAQVVPASVFLEDDAERAFTEYAIEHQLHLRDRPMLGICELWKDGVLVGKFRRRQCQNSLLIEWVGPRE